MFCRFFPSPVIFPLVKLTAPSFLGQIRKTQPKILAVLSNIQKVKNLTKEEAYASQPFRGSGCLSSDQPLPP
jgi:hypothetical protein